MKYDEKLRDPRWQIVRREILERDGWCCQICYGADKMLAVHHRCYTRNKEPWDCPKELLVTLCDDCHKAEKDDMSQALNTLCEKIEEKFFSGDILVIAKAFENMELVHIPSCIPHPSEVVAGAIAETLESNDVVYFLLLTRMQEKLIESFFGSLKKRITDDKR